MNCNDRFFTRQVHLDFHTSPDIPGIGSRFSKENFQQALKTGNLDSITVFAKCHHGLCYYPTDIGIPHPQLDFDLTGAMIDAAHEIGVRAPIYITAGWSDEEAKANPHWRAVGKDGKYLTTASFDPSAAPNHPKGECAWQTLCLNDGNDYTRYLYELTEEICRRYEKVDGLFFDICIIHDACYCEACQAGMRAMGLNPESEADAKRYFILKRHAFMEKCAEILKRYHPDATIFFNSGGADQYKGWAHDCQTHFEMEDLPTAWGGYDKLPLRAKFFGATGKPYIGMTGKFHLTWGEFGGFKTGDALKYEISTMALYGAGASIGDHMHPDGEMELQTYENIGVAYRYLEKIAPYCYGGESTANIGVVLSGNSQSDEGISNILVENQLDYELVKDNDFAPFDTVVIPGGVVLEPAGVEALKSYLASGGKLVLMADALVKDGAFQLDLGFAYQGGAEYDCDYLSCLEPQPELPNAPTLCYLPGHRVDAGAGEVLAEITTPYFSRTYGHFCGHRNTPHEKDAPRLPAIVRQGNVVYLAHDLPRQYLQFGCLYHKRYFLYALNLVYGGATVRAEGLGAQGRITMIYQPEKNRFCINMNYASPVRRGAAEIIEDILTVYDIRLTAKTEKQPVRVFQPLSGETLDFTWEEGTVRFTVPKLHCHTTVVVEY